MTTDSEGRIGLILQAADMLQERETPAESSLLQEQAENCSEDGQDTDSGEEMYMSGDDESDSNYAIYLSRNGGHGEGFEQGGERDSNPRAAASETELRSADYPRRKAKSRRSGEDISPEAKRKAAIALHNVKERQRRQDLKHAVLRLRNQLHRKTKRPSTISVLRAAQQEINELKKVEVSQEEELDAQKKKQNFLTWRLEKLISDSKSGQQSRAKPLPAVSMPSVPASPYYRHMHPSVLLPVRPPHHHSPEVPAAFPPVNVPNYAPVPNLTPVINPNAPLTPPHVFSFSPTHNHLLPLPNCSPHFPFLTMMPSPPVGTHHLPSPFVLPSFPNFGGIGNTGAIPGRFVYPAAHPFTLPHGSNYPIVPGTMLNPPPAHGPPLFQASPPPVPPSMMHHREQNSHPTALDSSHQARLDARENGSSEEHQDVRVHGGQGSKNDLGQLGDHNVHWTNRRAHHQHRDLETGQISAGDDEEELIVDDVKSPDCKGHEDNSSYPIDVDARTQTDGGDRNGTGAFRRENKTSSCTQSATHPSVITWYPKSVSGPPPLIKRVEENPDAAFVSKIIEKVRPQRERISQQGVLAEKRKIFSIQNSNNGRAYTGPEGWYSSNAVHQLKGKKNGFENSSLTAAPRSAVNVRTAAAIVCP